MSMRWTIVFYGALILLASCLQDAPFKKAYDGYRPVPLADGTQISDPAAEGMDPDFLDEAYALLYADDRFVMARSLLVFRHGKLVAEAYPDDPDDIGRARNIQSCTKSITSILTGIAVGDGWIDSLEEPLYAILPGSFDGDQRKRDITIQDALTMRTGLEFDNGSHTLELYRTKENSATYVLMQDYLYPSGTVMNYNDGAPQLLSKVMEQKTGMKLQEYARKRLFEPLDITDWQWETAPDGAAFGAFSLYLRPRDLGRIGQLLLQKGTWRTEQLIDSTYLAAATTVQTSANFHGEPYGFYFWILPGLDGYAALGHGGQFLYVAPDLDLVAVYTAWPYTSGAFFDQHTDLMSLIRESCR